MIASNSKTTSVVGILETKPVSFSKLIGNKDPSGREGHCSCSLGDKIYVFGGVSQSATDDCAESSDLLMFDTSSDTWTRIDASGDLPPPRSAAVINAVGKSLYLFGGLSQYSGWFDSVFVFDTENASWTKLLATGGPTGRDKLTSAVIGQSIYFFGGFGPKGSFQSDDEGDDDNDEDDDDIEENEISDVKRQQKAADFGWFNDLYILDTSTNSWNQPMQMNLSVPTMRAAHGMCSLGKYLLIFGGRDPVGRQNDIHIFDTVSKKWLMDLKENGSPPDRRSFHTLTAINDNLALVFGGRSESNDHFNDCHIFNKSNTTWYKIPLGGDIPTARGCHTCTLVNGRVVIYGGSANFMPEIQHCQEILNDSFAADVKDFVNVVDAVSCKGH